ncbi:MAG: YbaB/EbfC family nucleoid-associated protein [bacterium]|nr:YbaB/EbfC family nucleoid-associated protein [bacterium]
MFNKLKQVKDLRDKAKQLQNQLAQKTAIAEHDGVSILMDGNQEVLRVEISDELMNSGDKAKLETALRDAVNDGHKKIQRVIAEEMRSSGNFNIPGLTD